MGERIKHRRRGYTRVSTRNQVTIPLQALHRAGIRTGDRLRAEVRVPGEVILIRDVDPIDRYSGALTDVYAVDELSNLRREWD